jgi:two-component system KDP operon response regulator KdpE
MAAILIIDDDGAVRDTLARKLVREGFVVLAAKDGLEGLRVFHTGHPDLVILDVVMPGMDGVTVCERIREVAETPILMLSAQALSEEAIIEGLNAGADEYLAKPVRLNEFVARVRALLRRAEISALTGSGGYDDGYLRIDTQRRHVYVKQDKIHLTPTEYKLLMVLLENSGRVVPQRELLEQVWGPEYVDDVYYPRVYVSQLRRKIEVDPANPLYILTEHRIGYRFERRDQV